MPHLQGRHPAVMAVLSHFTYQHLPPELQSISRACHDLAFAMVDDIGDDPQLTIGLQHLLHAKDSFVRAARATRSTQE